MSTSLEAVFKMISGSIYLVIFILNIHVQRKTRFSPSSQNLYQKNRFLLN